MQLGRPVRAASAFGAAILSPALALASPDTAPIRVGPNVQVGPLDLDRRGNLGNLISIEAKALGTEDVP